MLNQSRTQNPEQWNEIGNQYLPKMTALFIEGLDPRPEERRGHAIWSHTGNEDRNPTSKAELKTSLSTNGKCSYLSATLPSEHDFNKPNAVSKGNLRTLICGISNCFNNLFMGIWGYISLIKLSEKTPLAVRSRVALMERLIQNGAVLVHIIFGYLAENHTEAKRLRLKQLLEEINECVVSNNEPFDLKTIEACMLWASNLNSPTRIARSIARVFEQLLKWVAEQHEDVLAIDALDATTQSRLKIIRSLVKRGDALLGQLKLYAGDAPKKLCRMRIKALINRVIDQAASHNSQISITTDMETPLPDIQADRSQLMIVLQQIIYNAINAMPNGGQLDVTARPLKMEQPVDRFVTHSGNEYIVVSISDNGVGMNHSTQERIFEPFFVADRSLKRVGLGLAVSNGIIKSHGGFIHVQSREGRGSTFKIYLPICRRYKSGEGSIHSAFGAPKIHNIHAVSCLI